MQDAPKQSCHLVVNGLLTPRVTFVSEEDGSGYRPRRQFPFKWCGTRVPILYKEKRWVKFKEYIVIFGKSMDRY
jgi:hypothetical protein